MGEARGHAHLQAEVPASQADLNDPKYAKLRHHPGGLRAILTASTSKQAKVSTSVLRRGVLCTRSGGCSILQVSHELRSQPSHRPSAAMVDGPVKSANHRL